jgi:hypothetical protein
MTTAKLQQRQATLINLITRVGGRQNIQKWMDELLQIDVKLETKEENKMFKINATDLHISIQKKLAKLIDGKLVKGVITTSVDPDSLNWHELEINIYGYIDTDADRLYECVSWEEATLIVDSLKLAIKSNFTSLDDWHKYQTRGAWGFFGSSLDQGISYYILGLDRKYCGQVFKATGRNKDVATYEQMDGFGFADSVDKHVFTKWEYKHSDGTIIWVAENRKIYTIPTEQEVVGRIQSLIYEHCKREKMTWQDFVSDIENRKQKNAAFDAAEEAARKAAEVAIPAPEWYQKEIYSKSLSRFWIGDDYLYFFYWNTRDGSVWEECDDRTRGLDNRTRNRRSLGSDKEVVLNYIHALLQKREEYSQRKQEREEAYEAYKKAQKAKGGIIKPLEKWLQTVA